MRESGRRRRALFTAATLLLSAALSLTAAECALDGWLDHQRRSAKAHPDYDATYRSELGPGGFGVPDFSGQVRDGRGGTVPWTNEEHGFRNDRDAAPAPPPGALRILSLGDSFSAGYRVGQDSTFSRHIEAWSTQRFGPTEVWIANIESPARGLAWLETYGWSWSPDLVLLGVTIGNDIAAAWVALHPTPITPAAVAAIPLPASARIERPPSRLLGWLAERRIVQMLRGQREAIGTSYNDATTPRLFDGINGLGVFLRETPAEIDAAYERLFRVLADFETACAAHAVPCAVLVFPQRFQIDPADWQLAVDHYELRAEAFDLRLPNRRIAAFCAGRALVCIDPSESMQAWRRAHPGDALYLPRGDMHWNETGHRVWFEGAQAALATSIEAARARRGLE